MRKEYIYAGVSIFCWSTVATITKLLLGNYNNFQLLWISAFFAGLFLLIVNLATGNIKKLKSWKWKDYLRSMAIGIPGTFLYYVFYYAGASKMPASQAFIVNYLWPIMSVVFACIILREKLTVKKILAILLSFVGVGISMADKLGDINSDFLLGAAFCAAGAISYGIFTALNTKYKYEKRLSMMLNYAVTFTITTLINGISGDLFIPSALECLGFAWNGAFTMAVAATLWVMALSIGKTEQISNLAYITPFVSMIWTALVLKDEITVFSIAGLVVIVSGILIQMIKPKKCAEGVKRV